jgi:hypothetical protein
MRGSRAWIFCITLSAFASNAYGSEDDRSIFGLQFDAGAPDGAQASLVIRPWSWIRAHAGAGHNLIGPGVRGGLTLIPFDTTVRPIFSFELGRFFEGDVPAIGEMKDMRVRYDYGSARGGLEADWGGGAFFIEAGVTKVLAHLSMPDVSVNAEVLAPCAKLGFIWWVD